MKLYLLTVFAILTVLVLLAVPPPTNAQEESTTTTTTEQPSLPEPPSPRPEPPSPGPGTGPFRPGPGPFRPGSFRPFPILRRFRPNPFNVTGNFTGRPFLPFPLPFFPPRNSTGSVTLNSVDFDDNASARVQDEVAKAPFVREPRDASLLFLRQLKQNYS